MRASVNTEYGVLLPKTTRSSSNAGSRALVAVMTNVPSPSALTSTAAPDLATAPGANEPL
ncbi:hypothetical protein DFQ13_11539 [Actinokineospora spheciospongiae]|nr:hypothetical protein DFQ13_11539 [Actinokineospora spheciospongiae]